jgi:hypothetical protein
MTLRVVALLVASVVGSATSVEAQFRSTLTFRGVQAPPASPPTVPRGPGLHGVLLPWAWWAPVYNLDAPLQRVPLADGAPTGGLQLDILPWRAQVFLDGVRVGQVDDFTGYYHHLETSAGSHQIVVIERGYTPLVFDVVVSPGRTTTLRGTLNEALRP